MKNKDDERLRKTTIAFLKDFAEKGYENAVECIDWLEKQGELKSVACGDDTIDSSYEVIINAAIYWGKEAPTENGIIPADKVKDAVDYYCSLLRNNDGWSEKDEKYLKLAIENFQTLGNSFLTTWLKNIKDRMQSKQIWKKN